MSRFFVSVILIAMLGTAITVRAEETEEKQTNESFWMKHKLALAQIMLTGLAEADYVTILESAQRMKTLSTLEGWARRANAKEYRRQLRMFEQANEQLILQCEEQNLDGATLAFTQITLSCVSCHKHLRAAGQPAAADK